MNLYDSETNEKIGVATSDQIEASLAAGDTGVITIDADGDVVREDRATKADRRVYVAD
jgi:hypothetical protein